MYFKNYYDRGIKLSGRPNKQTWTIITLLTALYA